MLVARLEARLDQEVPLEAVPRPRAESTIPQLRETHHAVARAVARGLTNTAIASRLGCSPREIRLYQADPSFQELVLHYRNEVEPTADPTADRLKLLALDVLDELRTRLLFKPDTLSVGQLVGLLNGALDRTGHGPSSKVETKHTFTSGGEIEEMRTILREERVTVINARATPDSAAAPRSAEIIMLPLAQDQAPEGA